MQTRLAFILGRSIVTLDVTFNYSFHSNNSWHSLDNVVQRHQLLRCRFHNLCGDPLSKSGIYKNVYSDDDIYFDGQGLKSPTGLTSLSDIN